MLYQADLGRMFLAVSMGADAGLQEGLDAYLGGNYGVALKELAPLAEKGSRLRNSALA